MTMSSLWQHPYVNLFRHFEVNQWKKAAKEGDVTSCMDKQTKCTVFKLAGVIPANNYIQLPKTGSQSLGLTGRYIYMAFKPIPDRYFVAHLDIASADGLVIRISFSNLFKEFKSTSTWLQFPFVVSAAHNSVDYQTGHQLKNVTTGAAPATTRWTLLVLDLQYILSIYLNRAYSHVKTVRVCANTLLKGIYTSDNYYEPGISQDECKKMGLLERGVNALPREMAFPLSRSDSWHEKYDLIRFPCDSNKTPIESLHKLPGLNVKPKTRSKSSPTKVPLVPAKSIGNSNELNKPSIVKAPNNPRVKFHKPSVVTSSRDLPEVGLDGNVLVDKTAEYQNQPKEVHVVMKSKKGKSSEPNRAKEAEYEHFRNEKRGFPMPAGAREWTKVNYKSLEPDPILKLKKVIGFGGASVDQAIWTHSGSHIVYPCHALVVAVHIATGKQRFFIGHTEKVSCITMTRDSNLLASGQTALNCCVRIWNYRTADCLSVFKVNASLIFSVDFSESGSVLALSGRDTHNKTLVAVWNTSRVFKGGEVNLISKAHTEVDVTKVKVCPSDDTRMVSCGRNNIRLWRIKDGSLRSAAVPLGDCHAMEFTDICWDYQPSAIADIRHPSADERKIYACSRSGHIFDVDHKRMSITDIYRLLPKRKDGEKQTIASGPGISINSVYANDTFCITGSSDGYLRVWPLDFKHVYLEAEHDGPVSVVRMSDNGLKILAGTGTGNLGVLDVTTRTHHNVMRSHTDRILHFSQDVFRRHFTTVSADHTIRVWSLETGQQLFDFYSSHECPVNICYHPSKQLFAVGFDNGSVRVFDIQAASLIADHSSHKGSVTGLAYMPDGSKLFSSGSDGTLCSYDTSEDKYSVLRLLGGIVAKGTQYGPDALAVSPHGYYVAFVGPLSSIITVVSPRTLDEVMKIDVTTVTTPADAARGVIDKAARVYYTPANTSHLIVTTENSRLLKFDASSGKLLAEIGNVHRSPCSSLDLSQSGRHLVTAGDRVVKVWDYQMRYDLNFQVYIGPSEPVSKVSFTPSYNEVVSCGDAIFIWQFLGSDDIQEDSLTSSEMTDQESMAKEISAHVTSPEKSKDLHSSLRAEMQDAQSSFSQLRLNTSFSDMPRQSAPRPSTPDRPRSNATTCPLSTLTPCQPQDNKAICKKTKDYISPKKKRLSDVPKPTVKRHFQPAEKTAAFAQKRYMAPENQAGLKLDVCIGYNGNGRENIIWQPETGFFAYTCGCVIVIEDLKSGKQRHLVGHIEEISTLASQSDGQEMVSASGSRGSTRSQLCFWDLSSMSCRKVIEDHESNIVALAYSRDDRFLVSVGDYQERRINVWETSTYMLIGSTVTCVPVHSVAWDPQAFSEFVTVGDNCAIMFWLIDEISDTTPKLRVQEPEVPEDIACLSHKIDFTCCCYAGNSTLYVGTNIGVITVWDTKRNTCILHWEADTCEITSLSVRHGRLVTGSTSKCCLRLWGLSGVAELALPGSRRGAANVEVEDEMSLDGFVVSMKLDDSLDMGIIGTDCGTIWYINWTDHSCVQLVSTNPSRINAVEFDSSGRFVTCADDGSLRIWSADDKEQILQFQVLDQKCLCAAFSPSHEKSQIYGHQPSATFTLEGKKIPYSFLSAGYGDGTVRVFDTNKAEMIMKIQPHRTGVTDVTFATASILISGDESGFIALTSTFTGMTIRIINDHKGAPINNFDVANWKNDSNSVTWLACSADRRVSIWTANWSRDSCILKDWLTFPAPAIGPNGQTDMRSSTKAYYSSLPPSVAKFSTCEKDVVVYTGYGLTKSIHFYDITNKSVTRTITLTHWARCMDLSNLGSLISTGTNERLLQIYDYNEGTFQDYAGNDNSVRLVKFSNDGSYLLTVVDKVLSLWKVLL